MKQPKLDIEEILKPSKALFSEKGTLRFLKENNLTIDPATKLTHKFLRSTGDRIVVYNVYKARKHENSVTLVPHGTLIANVDNCTAYYHSEYGEQSNIFTQFVDLPQNQN